MNKTLKRTMALAFVCAMGISMTACGGSVVEEIDETKTQLRVYNYNGGYGTTWLAEAKKEYEALHTDVQIMLNPQKPSSATLDVSGFKSATDDLYFSENMQYFNLVAGNALEDISDAITSPNPYDNNKTILSKLTEQQQEYYNVGTTKTEIYGLPHYSGNIGFIYNIDLFEEKGFYFKAEKPTGDCELEDYFIIDKSDAKSKGPDGKAGTDDDGLPATYDEFLTLLDYIKDSGITPITWTGKYRDQYVGYTMNSLVMDYEGKDQAMLNYTMEGTATDLGHVDESGNFVIDSTPTTITPNNGYELARQAGKYYAMDFMKEIFQNEKFYDRGLAINSSDENTAAQLRFVRGQAAILMEGVWWEAEAEAANSFSDMNTKKSDYNFGWMPFPKATEDKIGQKDTICDTMFSLCCVKKGIGEKQKEIAKDFIQFLYSDTWLKKFTQITGTVKAVNYEMTEEELNGLTTYEKSLYKFKANADLMFPYSKLPLFYNNQTLFDGRNYYKALIGSSTYENAVTYLLQEKKDDAIGYFNGMVRYYETKWDATFGEYLNK